MWQARLEKSCPYFEDLGMMAQGLDGTAAPRDSASCNCQDADQSAQVRGSIHQLSVDVEKLFLEVT